MGRRIDAGCTILLVGGSLRAGSVNTAVLRTAEAVAPPDVRCIVYDGLRALPPFDPDDDRDPLPAPAADLRARLDAADAVLFSTPEYAGSLPGAFKNLLDWTVGGGMYEKPAAWVNASQHDGGGHGAEATLRRVLGYVNADVVEAACARIPVPRLAVGADGLISDPAIRAALAKAIEALAAHVSERASRQDG